MSFRSLVACFRLLTPRQRRDYWIVVILATFSAIMEMVGIGAIIPVVSLLVNSDGAIAQGYLRRAYIALGSPPHEIFVLSITAAAIGLVWLSGLTTFLTVYARQRYLNRIKADIAARVYRRYMSNSIETFLARPSSEFMRDVNGVSERVSQGVVSTSTVLVARLIQIIVIVTILLVVNYRITMLLALVIFGSYLGIYMGIRKRIVRMSLDNFGEARSLQQLLIGSYQSYRSIVIDRQTNRFAVHFSKLIRATARRGANIAIMASAPKQAVEVTGMSVLFIAAYFIGQTSTDSQEFVSITALFGVAAYRLLPAAQQLYHAISGITYSLAVFEKVAPQWGDLTVPSLGGGGSRHLSGRPSLLVADRVSYRHNDHVVLSNFSAELQLTGIIRIAGPSGAGKSTFVEILTGLRLPQSGQVLLDGIPLDQIERSHWWSRISYLSQSDYLFEGTLASNVTLDDTTFDLHRFKKVASICGLHAIGKGSSIVADTEQPINEGGTNLSGGQRNRVLVARALYKRSDVIFLDEAFAALDVDAARDILERTQSEFAERCIIIISHRETELPPDVRVVSIA